MTVAPGQRLPGYPVADEWWLWWRDGRTVWVRPIVPLDAPELAEAIRTADADTLYRRFLGAPSRITPALLTWLTTVDYVRRFAVVAFDPITERGVAIARYGPLEEGVAELAAENRPIAALLVHAGAGAKQLIEHGITELAVTLEPDQVAALQRDLASHTSRS